MLDPNQFQVNDAWIVFKLNDAPVCTAADGDFNVLALMDAASCFMLGAEFIRADSMEASQLESKRLLKGGYSHKQQYPRTLFIPTNQNAEILSIEAEFQGIVVKRVKEDQLRAFINEARQGFREHISEAKLQ